MTSQDVRTKLKNGEVSLGTWLQLPSPDVAEIIGRAGYDWAAVDMEHGAFTRSNLPDIFRALELGGTLPFARLLEATPGEAKCALDSGARGLIFPMIESFAQLDRVIAASLYPGEEDGNGASCGVRGVGFSRANLYGRELASHMEPENGAGRNIVLVAQIEHIKALKELDAIFAHPRLDAYMIGPYDLSASMGLTGQFEHPDFIAAVDAISRKALECDVPKGFHVVEPSLADLQTKINEGYAFIAYGIDAVFLARKSACPAGKL